MAGVPSEVREVFVEWSDEFAKTNWPRFRLLGLAAVVCVGRHAVSRKPPIIGTLADGHWSSDHHLLSKRRWSTRRLARILAEHVVDRFVPLCRRRRRWDARARAVRFPSVAADAAPLPGREGTE